MQRSLFYADTKIEGVEERDFLHTSLTKFEMRNPVSFHMVSASELMRPDLISYRHYRTVDYWWLVCLVNGIEDPLVDLQMGQKLVIPNVLDIYTFYKEHRTF